jgi:hypothetical protein
MVHTENILQSSNNPNSTQSQYATKKLMPLYMGRLSNNNTYPI